MGDKKKKGKKPKDKAGKKAKKVEVREVAHPMYADAHPTAPGGMSQAALREEMTEKHNYLDIEVDEMSWPEMIDAVAKGRRQRELEAEEAAQAAVVQADIEERAAGLLIKSPDTLDYLFDGHAGAGPSASERWISCTGSLGLSREFLETLTPNQRVEFAKSGLAARQGTTAHKAAEAEAGAVLGLLTEDEVDQTLLELAVMPETEGEAYNEEMGEWITEYVDLVKQYHDEGRTVLIEQRVSAVVPLSGAYDGEVYEVPGSADMIVLPGETRVKELVIGDLKYGNGIDVDVDENSQARTYALGELSALADDEGNLPDIDRIVYHIIQPRLGGIKTWSESLDDLLDWRDEVLSPALTSALFGPEAGAELVPSEGACQWCPARGACPALALERMENATQVFDAIVDAEFVNGSGSLPDTALMDGPTLGSLLSKAEGLTKLVDELKAETQRRLYRGEDVDGYHLVNYSPKRYWSGEAEDCLSPANRDEGVLPEEVARILWKPEELVSPTQALKLVGKGKEKLLEPFIVVPEKRPVAAKVTDRRKKWEGKSPEDMFDEIKEED